MRRQARRIQVQPTGNMSAARLRYLMSEWKYHCRLICRTFLQLALVYSSNLVKAAELEAEYISRGNVCGCAIHRYTYLIPSKPVLSRAHSRYSMFTPIFVYLFIQQFNELLALQEGPEMDRCTDE